MEEMLSTKSHNKHAWYLPGGKREPGESDIAALAGFLGMVFVGIGVSVVRRYMFSEEVVAVLVGLMLFAAFFVLPEQKYYSLLSRLIRGDRCEVIISLSGIRISYVFPQGEFLNQSYKEIPYML